MLEITPSQYFDYLKEYAEQTYSDEEFEAVSKAYDDFLADEYLLDEDDEEE